MCGADLEEDCASFLWHYFCRAGVWVQGWWEEVRASHIKRTLFIRRDLGTGNRNYLYLDAMLFFFSFFFFNPIPNCVWLDFLVWFPLGTKVLPKQCPPERVRMPVSPKIDVYPLSPQSSSWLWNPRSFLQLLWIASLLQTTSWLHLSPTGKPASLAHLLLRLNNPS